MSSLDKLDRQLKSYELVFRIENLLRVSVHNILTQKIGIDYLDKVYLERNECDGQEKAIIDIHNKSKERKKVEKIYKLKLGFDYPLLWYIDYFPLILLIDKYWDQYFRDMFNNSAGLKKELIYRLKHVANIRNSVAHNRYISKIELSDLENTLTILNQELKKELLFNYNDLVFNSMEDIKNKFIKNVDYIIEIVKEKKCINNEKLLQLKSSFSAIVNLISVEFISQFDNILQILIEYNKLPRKPGCSDVIKKFINENGLFTKLEYIKNI